MKLIKKLIGPIVVLLLIFAVLANGQAIVDWARLRNYDPPAEIEQLSQTTTMTDHGRNLFYVNHPKLLDRQQFRENCTNNEESIVLGCYIQGKGIFLFDVQDERLEGIEEVTAAHEMLHEAYERLGDEERQEIDSLTQQAFDESANDRLRRTIDAYRKRDPSVVPNELHSIIATEVRNIPVSLENYYSKYFTNRKAIVSLSEKYESEFTKREKLAQEYKQQLDSIKEEVDRLNEELSARAEDLSREYQILNNNRNDIDAESFNKSARDYNQKVQSYNSDVRYTSGLIDQYNEILKKYNDVVVEENELIKSIDSRPSTINS